MSLTSRYKRIGIAKLRPRSVSIMQRLRSQSDDALRSGDLLAEVDKQTRR